MATCSINSNELEIILTNDAQNTISVDSAIETYSDVLECKIQSKDIILEKVDNSIVVLELTINGSKYVTEATLVDDENSFIKINEETLHLVKDNKSSNNVLEESVEEVEEVKVDELTKFLGEKIEDFTNQKLTEKVEEIKTFSSNTLYENLETFEEKKKDLLELVEEQFTNVVDGVQSDVNKKLDRFFKRTDLNNKTAIAIETDRLKEEITEKYNSFLAELNNKKKNLEEINGDKVNQLVEDKKEEITNVIKLFVEKIYSEYKEEFNPKLKNIITENKQLNEKVQQLENIKKDIVNNKVYSEDITRAENNFKKLLKETNKKFNKVNEKLNLISKKDNTRYNSLLAAINDTDTKEYETVLNNKIEQAELGQIKEELEQSLTSSMRSEVTSLKRYAEMSAGGGTNAKQYANGGTMDGNLNVTGELKADTILATTLLSAGTMDINFELSGFSVTGDLSANGNILSTITASGDNLILEQTANASNQEIGILFKDHLTEARTGTTTIGAAARIHAERKGTGKNYDLVFGIGSSLNNSGSDATFGEKMRLTGHDADTDSTIALKVTGGIQSTVNSAAVHSFIGDGTIKSTAYEPADFPTTTSVRTTAAFKDDGTMVQDEKIVVVKVTGEEARAMTTNSSSFITLIPAPGANKVIVVRELEIFIDRGTWVPQFSQSHNWNDDFQVVVETPAKTLSSSYGTNNFSYNTFATLQKKFINHTINNVFVAAGAVPTIIVRDAPAVQTRAYPNKPLLLKPKSSSTYTGLQASSIGLVDDDYYFRITYKIMDMTTDFAVTTT